MEKQRLLWKSPEEKENYEQSTRDACEEEEEDEVEEEEEDEGWTE